MLLLWHQLLTPCCDSAALWRFERCSRRQSTGLTLRATGDKQRGNNDAVMYTMHVERNGGKIRNISPATAARDGFSFFRLVERAESFGGRAWPWRGFLPVSHKPLFFSLYVLIIAETEWAEPDLQTDSDRANVSSGTKGVSARLLACDQSSARMDQAGLSWSDLRNMINGIIVSVWFESVKHWNQFRCAFIFFLITT